MLDQLGVPDKLNHCVRALEVCVKLDFEYEGRLEQVILNRCLCMERVTHQDKYAADVIFSIAELTKQSLNLESKVDKVNLADQKHQKSDETHDGHKYDFPVVLEYYFFFRKYPRHYSDNSHTIQGNHQNSEQFEHTQFIMNNALRRYLRVYVYVYDFEPK